MDMGTTEQKLYVALGSANIPGNCSFEAKVVENCTKYHVSGGFGQQNKFNR
jgi:hypothetical protein